MTGCARVKKRSLRPGPDSAVESKTCRQCDGSDYDPAAQAEKAIVPWGWGGDKIKLGCQT
jgi:hypothetical protein